MEQAMRHDAVVEVSVETLQNIARLETSWKELEARATHSFYLSWLWIGTWRRHLPEGAQPHVLVARTSSKIVGLAIICWRRAWSFGPHARARWLLNETGDTRFDRLFIEYNNILAERSLADAIIVACLEALTHRLHHSDQLVLSGIDPDLELAACRTAGRAGLVSEVKAADTARWIDFAKVRQRNLPPETIYTLVGQATFLVLPSQCYENFLRVIIEAFFAKGTPLIASKLGTMAEIVHDGHLGLDFKREIPSISPKKCEASSQIRASCGRCGRPLARNLIISSLPTSIITVWRRFKSGRSVLAARLDQQSWTRRSRRNEKWTAYPV
jgi:hypothetical protein